LDHLISQKSFLNLCFFLRVENNCLPATFAIHRALKSELDVDNRIGATFGKVYCGVVGGLRRHEFACMGAPVNLAARLMSSKVNNGILVDEAVHEQCRGRYTFKNLPPVKAKGYDKPVPILQPNADSGSHAKKRKSTVSFVGRSVEKQAIHSIAKGIQEESLNSKSSMIFLTGESGMGKSALAFNVIEDLKKNFTDSHKVIITARSTSTETEHRIPLSSYRKIFLRVLRQRCENDGDLSRSGPSRTSEAKENPTLSPSGRSLSRRGRLMKVSSMAGSKLSMRFRQPNGQCSVDDGGSKHQRRVGFRRGSAGNLTHSVHGAVARANLSESKHGRKPKRSDNGISQSLHRSSHTHDSGRASNIHGSHTARGDDSDNDSVNSTSLQRQSSTVPYFEKLCVACDDLEYPYEYADIVGSQFLGFDCASPITHVDGHVPTMDELVDFLAMVFVKIIDFAQFVTIVLDDFQWVDGFSWRVFREICSRSGNILLLCATRSHDKQALRRITSAVSPDAGQQVQMIEISLGPFDFTDIRDIISNVLVHKKSAISDSLCSDIFQRTGGLPVFVIQLLENIKRNRTLELIDGSLQWTSEGLKQKKNFSNTANGAVMEETFLSRFDVLDVRVRKVLQTCAVWGISFQLSDVVQVHPEMDEGDIESSLDFAMDEMILIEQEIEENDDDEIDLASDLGSSRRATGPFSQGGVSRSVSGERYFQFSHAMWRKNVLATMLKERKIELHRLIAEAMERNQAPVEEDSDISRLLTLFDHWKACGDFSKVAPLALTVGSRLEEWDLSAQSLELYEDALEMVFDGIEPTDEEATISTEWVRVKGRTIVLELILRLHVRIGLCHQRLGDEYQSILYFEDAYNTIKSTTKLSGVSKSLRIPILSSLCVLKLERETPGVEETMPIESLITTFVAEAEVDGTAIHVGRACSLQALYFAKRCDFAKALDLVAELDSKYDFEQYSSAMVAEYGRNYPLECLALSAQWLYLLGMFEEAEQRADVIMDHFLNVLDVSDLDGTMPVVLPIIQVYSLLERAQDSYWILKRYVIHPFQDYQSTTSDFWVPLFHPLAYLLELIIMDETGTRDDDLLQEITDWWMKHDASSFEEELQRKAHTLLGELGWRLLRSTEDMDAATRALWIEKVRALLTPIAQEEGAAAEYFQKAAAQALLDSL
jgi:Adenylate and Guanylate cyclase catalytic domain